MVFLTFNEYVIYGGMLDEFAFNRCIFRACKIIETATYSRVTKMKEIPETVKRLCCEIVDILGMSENLDARISSKSQAAGNVSESVSYVTSSKDEISSEIDSLILDYLFAETDDRGFPLLYRGGTP